MKEGKENTLIAEFKKRVMEKLKVYSLCQVFGINIHTFHNIMSNHTGKLVTLLARFVRFDLCYCKNHKAKIGTHKKNWHTLKKQNKNTITLTTTTISWRANNSSKS